MTTNRKQQIHDLLKGIETGDPKAVEVVNESKYIQHNPLTKEGNVGLAELFKRLSKTNPHVEIIRVFEDGEFVFAHTDYDFNVVDVGFEVFRFEENLVVEHWDNLQSKSNKLNLSGHSMLDGSKTILDLDKTEQNRELIKTFVSEVLINNHIAYLNQFVSTDKYIEHNPNMADGFSSLETELNNPNRSYNKNHRLLAEGNFVLSVCEGFLSQQHVSFYDLFRIEDKKIVEHWDTIDNVPPRAEWVNENGKF